MHFYIGRDAATAYLLCVLWTLFMGGLCWHRGIQSQLRNRIPCIFQVRKAVTRSMVLKKKTNKNPKLVHVTVVVYVK